MFGLIMLVECWRFWSNGWIERHYIAPEFFFKYYGFEWVEPWPGDGMYWHFAALALLSLLIRLGVLYRLATVLFFFAFSYVFLLDQARYLNHFYLVVLIAIAADGGSGADAALARCRHGRCGCSACSSR